MRNEVFLDTAYAIALSIESDSYHELASQIAEHLLRSRTKMISTRAVVFEIGNALSKKRYRSATVRLLEALEGPGSRNCSIDRISLSARALELFKKRPDRDWCLVDCLSFIVMEEHRIIDALTSDEHFEQAGFHRILVQR